MHINEPHILYKRSILVYFLFVCLLIQSQLLKRWYICLSGSGSYSTSVRKEETDPTQLAVAEYILTVISQYES